MCQALPQALGPVHRNRRDFPGSSLIRTLYFQCMECGFEPWSRKILHGMWHGQKGF